MGHDGKYAKKTPFKRFLHKYTGFIIMGIFAVIVASAWLYIENEKVFFENWSCHLILPMDHTTLIGVEHERFHEIYDSCQDDQLFTP